MLWLFIFVLTMLYCEHVFPHREGFNATTALLLLSAAPSRGHLPPSHPVPDVLLCHTNPLQCFTAPSSGAVKNVIKNRM